jgi:hypothetical protein
MMHCVRLLFTARDIAMMHKVVVDRTPERDFLLNIKQGGWKYDDILQYSERLVEEVTQLFSTSGLKTEEYSVKEIDDYTIAFAKYALEPSLGRKISRLWKRLLHSNA